MAQSRAALWTCLLGAGLVLVVPPVVFTTSSNSSPRPPVLTGCVFQNRANVTCHWEAGDAPATHYTLQVQKFSNRLLQMFTCTTHQTSCTAALNNSSVRFTYCIMVTAHAGRGNVSSATRCRSGRTEVMLPPVTLDSIRPVTGMPRCLTVSWKRILGVFPVSSSEVKTGNLNSQIMFTAQGQLDSQVRNVTVTNFTVQVCFFRPYTSYTIRLRHRFQGPDSPWSPWSNAQQGRTAEAAPSAAPSFWRRIQRRDEDGWRRVSLLWKPLPQRLANGRVLFYSVTCQMESARTLDDHGSCRALHHNRTSCSLLLPVGRCSCSLTASNSAGTSPEARVWLLGSSDPEPPSPSHVTANPLDENSLDVRWAAPADGSVTGFVLEWFAVRDATSTVVYWKRLNSSCRALVITEGIEPKERYSVSVTVLYGERGAGDNTTLHVYTVQGAPSAGPVLKVQQLNGSAVELSWSPVAVELRHGFIRNYTLCYSVSKQKPKCVFVPGRAHTCSLKNLLPGNYVIFMWANTDAGAGAAGPINSLRIDPKEMSVLMCALLPPVVMLLALVLMGCLVQHNVVKQKLCQDVPDPSHSSLAHWTPKTALMGMNHPLVTERSDIKYSEVSVPAERELQTCDSHEETFNLQTYASLSCSPATIQRSSIHQNPRMLELLNPGDRLGSGWVNRVDLSPCTYSNVLTSPTLRNASTLCMSPFYCHAVGTNDVKEEEPPAQRSHSSLSPTDKLKPCGLFLKPYQIPDPFPDVDGVSQSTSVLSPPAYLTSLNRTCSQSTFNSASSLQLESFARPDAPPSNLSVLFSPLRPLVFVDMSYCSVKCEHHSSLIL